MLKRITIENYRSCLRTTFDCHPNLSVLIGPNSSGKTNILQAIMFLNKMPHREEYDSHRDVMAVNSRIKTLFSFGRTQIQLNASVDAYNDESNNDVLTASQVKWLITRPNGERKRLKVPLYAVARYREQLKWPRLNGFRHKIPLYIMLQEPKDPPRWVISAVIDALKFCEGISYYGASQFTNPGACPVSFEIEQEKGKPRRVFRLRGHERVLYRIYLAQKSEIRTRYDQFLDIVGPKGLKLIDELTFKEVPTSSTDYSVRVGGKVVARRRYKRLIIPQFRIGKQRLSPNQLSEGTFKTLALLFFMITEDSRLLLIEEPEVCIHHGLLSSIMELIKSYSQHKQMIVSTHSDYVLDHLNPENVFRVSYDKLNGTVVHHIRKTMTGKEYSALREYLNKEGNLGEFWREGGLENLR